jgi:peptidoglycan-associated lipoprotein
MRAAFPFARLVLPALVLGFAPLAGCKKPEYPACKKDKHCKKDLGETCVDGTCQNCKADTDCTGKGAGGANWVCKDFRCTDPAAAGSGGRPTGDEGAPCSQRTDCIGGLSCKAGVCSMCTEDVDCAPNSCNLSSGRCSPENQCQTDDQCPMDQICDGGMCVFSGDMGQSGAGICGLDAVFFAYDSDDLTPNVQEELKKAADCFAQQNRKVYLEAHADKRGSEEYNIMLTDRRGNAVKSYLETLGVKKENMDVVGKGNLEATGTDEVSMGKDRRVQFIWKD